VPRDIGDDLLASVAQLQAWVKELLPPVELAEVVIQSLLSAGSPSTSCSGWSEAPGAHRVPRLCELGATEPAREATLFAQFWNWLSQLKSSAAETGLQLRA
jgi:hypothetical protein